MIQTSIEPDSLPLFAPDVLSGASSSPQPASASAPARIAAAIHLRLSTLYLLGLWFIPLRAKTAVPRESYSRTASGQDQFD